jgi:hypothetical protein
MKYILQDFIQKRQDDEQTTQNEDELVGCPARYLEFCRGRGSGRHCS